MSTIMKEVITLVQELLPSRKAYVEIKRLSNGNLVYAVTMDKSVKLFTQLEKVFDFICDGDESGKLCTLPEGIDVDKFLLDAQVMFS